MIPFSESYILNITVKLRALAYTFKVNWNTHNETIHVEEFLKNLGNKNKCILCDAVIQIANRQEKRDSRTTSTVLSVLVFLK